MYENEIYMSLPCFMVDMIIDQDTQFYDNHIQTCDASHLEDILLKTALEYGNEITKMRLLQLLKIVGLILLHLNASLGRCGGESNSIGGNSDKLNNSTGVHQLP